MPDSAYDTPPRGIAYDAKVFIDTHAPAFLRAFADEMPIGFFREGAEDRFVEWVLDFARQYGDQDVADYL